MNVTARAHNGELRVLIAPDVATGGKVPAGSNNLLTIPVDGNGTIELVESQFADANGALLEVEAAAKLVPTSYALAGQVVKTFAGEAEVGTINIRWDGRTNDGVEAASGMYFYSFKANDFSMTRKMVVLK